jgi:hypothetical protein
LERGEWFRWLSLPSVKMIQLPPVHGGVTTDPSRTLEKLFVEIAAPLERPLSTGRLIGKA